MSTYTIQNIDGDYVTITIRIADQTFNQRLCGMPTDDADALQEQLSAYVASYEADYLAPIAQTTPTPAEELIGQEITATDTPVIELVPEPPVVPEGN
jgi:hypothetical protein